MEQLLIYRERIIKFITGRGRGIQFIGRFFAGFVLFFVVTQIYGYSSTLNELFVVLVLAMTCVFVPNSVIFLLFNLIIIMQLSALSVEVGLVYFVLIGLYYLIYQRMFPKAKLIFMMTPVFFFFHVPAILPIFVGAFIGFSGLPAILMGAFSYYLANIVQSAVLQMENGTTTGHLYTLLVKGTTGNKELLLCILVFVLVAALVAGIHKLYVAYGWYISILVGGLVYLLAMLVGGYFADAKINILSEIIMIIISMFVVMIIQFLYNVIDYTREETFEFEDEEYYYYVKAIPKISVEEEEINITKINKPVKRFYLKKKEKKNEGEES